MNINIKLFLPNSALLLYAFIRICEPSIFQGEQPEWECLIELFKTFIFVSAYVFRVSNLSESAQENTLQELFKTFIFLSALYFQGEQPEWEYRERPTRVFQYLHSCERSLFSGWATWVRVPRRTISKSCSNPSDTLPGSSLPRTRPPASAR